MSVMPAVPTGPFDAVRQGWRLCRQNLGVLVGEILVAGAVSLVFVAIMRAVQWWPVTSPAPMIRMSFGASLAFFAMGLLGMVLDMGIMRSMTVVLAGGRARIQDLGWGLRRGEIWLLAVVIEVANLILQGILEIALLASGLRPTGDPKHPFLALHGLVWPSVTLLAGMLALGIVANTAMLAMATASRAMKPAFGALRDALRTFARGYRRFLWINLAVMLVFAGWVLLGGIIAVGGVFLLHLLGTGALARLLSALGALVLVLAVATSILVTAAVLLASFVTASASIGATAP